MSVGLHKKRLLGVRTTGADQLNKWSARCRTGVARIARGPAEGDDNYDSRVRRRKQDREAYWPDREIEERDLGEREPEDLNPEDNEAHAPGQVCARCGAVITAGQDVRLQADDRWVHEVCP
jgi:hypothetical protein